MATAIVPTSYFLKNNGEKKEKKADKNNFLGIIQTCKSRVRGYSTPFGFDRAIKDFLEREMKKGFQEEAGKINMGYQQLCYLLFPFPLLPLAR